MLIKPLSNYVLLEPIEAEEKTSAGLFIPEDAKEHPKTGIIRAIGPGKIVDGKLQALKVKLDDKVIYMKWKENEVKLEGQNYILVDDDDILATYK